MRALDRKLVRDLWGLGGQTVAIALVIAAGVATFVMSLTTLVSLDRSRATYYERYRFAHVFCHLKRAPELLRSRIAEIPGVAQAEVRIVADVTIQVAGMEEPASGRLISQRVSGSPPLNDLYLRRGRALAPGRGDEVLVSEAFFQAHQLRLGDTVSAVINGRRQDLRIVGVVLSPEYLISVPPGTLLPDDRRFGVFWMDHEALAAAYDMDGAFNDVALLLMRGAVEAEVLLRLDDLVTPYGGMGAYGRSDQLSHQYISDEIRQLRSMGLVAPSIFLGVAAFLLNVVMARLIGVQREQIAALKAFGYSRREIGLHYLKLVLAITACGVVLGVGVGDWMGIGLTRLYTRFYRFPVFGFVWDTRVVLAAVAISGLAAVVGTLGAVRRAVRLPPAEAMRPEPPAEYRPTLIERTGLGLWLPPTTKMILRQLERRPWKSLLSVLGIATSVAVLVMGSFMVDSLDYIMDYQFQLAQRQDITVTYVEPANARALQELRHLPGVIDAEPMRTVATRLRAGPRSRRTAIMGLPAPSRLYRLLDSEERVVRLPPGGVTLSSKLAELLDVRVGDLLRVEVLEGERPVRDVRVVALINEFSGTNAYMEVDELHRLLREGPTVSAVFLRVDAREIDRLYARLKETPRVAGVQVKRAALESFRETIAENLLRMKSFNVMFAGIIAFGVVYNSARISLAERSRELATLRVIGFTRGEISAILLGELAVITGLAIPLGLVLGHAFAAFTTLGLDTEIYRIPLVIRRSTYGFAATVTVLATVFSGLVVRRRIDHLDLIAVLKTRE